MNLSFKGISNFFISIGEYIKSELFIFIMIILFIIYSLSLFVYNTTLEGGFNDNKKHFFFWIFFGLYTFSLVYVYFNDPYKIINKYRTFIFVAIMISIVFIWYSYHYIFRERSPDDKLINDINWSMFKSINKYFFTLSIIVFFIVFFLEPGYFWKITGSYSNNSTLFNIGLYILLLLTITICIMIILSTFGIKIMSSLEKIFPYYGLGHFIVKFIFYIPCLLLDIFNKLRYEYNITTKPYILLVFIELIIIAIFLNFNSIKKSFNQLDGSKILQNDPIYLNTETNIGTYQDLYGFKNEKNEQKPSDDYKLKTLTGNRLEGVIFSGTIYNNIITSLTNCGDINTEDNCKNKPDDCEWDNNLCKNKDNIKYFKISNYNPSTDSNSTPDTVDINEVTQNGNAVSSTTVPWTGIALNDAIGHVNASFNYDKRWFIDMNKSIVEKPYNTDPNYLFGFKISDIIGDDLTHDIFKDDKTILEINSIYNNVSNEQDGEMHRYNYAISCWIYIDAQSPNTSESYTRPATLLSYSNKPLIYYNGRTQTLGISMSEKIPFIKDSTGNNEYDKERQPSNNNILFEQKDIELQKWHNIIINNASSSLDIFLNGRLVSSTGNIIPYGGNDMIVIGENNGIRGGICNVIYYPYYLDIYKIEEIYNLNKNKKIPSI